MANEPMETAKMTNELLSLNKRHPGIVDWGEVEQTIHIQAKAYATCGKWEDAAKIYVALYNECLQQKKSNTLIMIGLTRAVYEIHEYDNAIEFGMTIIKASRCIPGGVHKYVALAQKEK